MRKGRWICIAVTVGVGVMLGLNRVDGSRRKIKRRNLARCKTVE
jgi:hypothetical protein